MTIKINHAKVATVEDLPADAAAGKVLKADWNADLLIDPTSFATHQQMLDASTEYLIMKPSEVAGLVQASNQDAKNYTDAKAGAQKSTALTDMPSAMLNKGGKILAVDGSEQKYTQVDLINGFFNFKPENYLKTRAAYAGYLAGLSNFNIGWLTSDDGSYDPNAKVDYRASKPTQLARRLSMQGLIAQSQNWFGTSRYGGSNTTLNGTDIRRSNLAPAWETNSGTYRSPAANALRNFTNSAVTDPLIYRCLDGNLTKAYDGAPLICDTMELFYQDYASGDGICDNFIVKAGVLENAKTVTAATKANPGVFTVTAHGYAVGDLVVPELNGMTQFDGRILAFVNAVVDANNIQLRLTSVADGGASVDTSAYGTFTSGTIRRIALTTVAATSRTINGGVTVVRRAEYTFAGAQVWTVYKSAGNTNILDIKGLNCYNKATPQISIYRWGGGNNILSWSGAPNEKNEIGNIASTNANSGLAGGSATTSSKTPLVMIELGMPDNGNAQSIIETNLTNITQYLKAAGADVLYILDMEVDPASIAQDAQNAAKYAMYKCAIANDVAVCDIRALRKSYTDSLNAGLIGANIRYTPKGSADSANIVSQFFPLLAQNNKVSALGLTTPYVPIKVSILSGGTSKVIAKELIGNHNSTGMLQDTTFKVGSIRPHSPDCFWSGVELGEDGGGNPIYDWTHLDEWILGADAIGASIMYTFSSTPRHCVRQDWYNGITTIQRNTAYNTLGTLARPFTGNNCLYVLTKVGTTAATEPTNYPTSNAGSDFPYNMIQVRPGNGNNSAYLVAGTGMSVAAGIYQPPGPDGTGRTCTSTVADGTTVWQLAGDPWNAPTNAFPSEPAKAQRFATAFSQRYNAVSPVNPTGKILVKFFELGSNEPNVQNSIAAGLTAYAASMQFSIVTGTQLVDTCEAQGNGIRSVSTTPELQSPGFTQYGSIAAGSVNAFMQASNTAGTLKGYDTCDTFNFHPYGGLYSPTWAGDLIDSTYFGITAAKNYIAGLPAGNNPRGIPYRNMKINISEWAIIAENITPTYGGADTNMIAMRNWMASENPAVRYADKMIVKLIAAAQGMTGFYEFKWDMSACGNMQLNTVQGWPADPNGVRKANNDMYGLIGQTITEAYRYIDGTNRFEFKINGVTYIYGRP